MGKRVLGAHLLRRPGAREMVRCSLRAAEVAASTA